MTLFYYILADYYFFIVSCKNSNLIYIHLFFCSEMLVHTSDYCHVRFNITGNKHQWFLCVLQLSMMCLKRLQQKVSFLVNKNRLKTLHVKTSVTLIEPINRNKTKNDSLCTAHVLKFCSEYMQCTSKGTREPNCDVYGLYKQNFEIGLDSFGLMKNVCM